MKRVVCFILLSFFLAGCSGSQQSERVLQRTSVQAELHPTKTPNPTVNPGSINLITPWQKYTDEKYQFSFQYPADYSVKVNAALTYEKYVYLDVFSPDNQRLAQVQAFSDSRGLPPRDQQFSSENALGSADGVVSYQYQSNPGEQSFYEYAVVKNGVSYIVHWYGSEEKSPAQEKFVKSFVFEK